MKKKDIGNTIYPKIANICAVASVVFLGGAFIADSLLSKIDLPVSLIGFIIVLTFLLLSLAIKYNVTLSPALDERNSFRNLMSTTANYVAIVDELNQVVYASKPLSQFTGIDDPMLILGLPFTDVFPTRELKLLAGNLLARKEEYAADWDFKIDGQKRFFKVYSGNMAGSSKSVLINMYDFTYLAERDEMAVMKDSLKIGIFFMDRNYIIQDHYSRYLEELLSIQGLAGKCFTDILSDSVTGKELGIIRDYFEMIFKGLFDQRTLEEINPFNEFQYVCVKAGVRKVFQCGFIAVQRARGEIFVLVTIYDITAEVELQRRLLEEEAMRHKEMQSTFELLQADRAAFKDFLDDAEYEFARIDKALENNALESGAVLVEVYQSIHAIKSNAITIGLNTFGDKVHNLESKIKKMRDEEGEIPFADMLDLTIEIERLSREKEGFKDTIEKIKSFGSGDSRKHSDNILIDSLFRAAAKTAENMDKKVRFVEGEIDPEVIKMGPRRIIKGVLMQLVRNSVVHGIEKPMERLAKGKDETGTICLSIKLSGENIHLRLTDDGKGFDFEKIHEKAIQLNLIPKASGITVNKDLLTNAIFLPGFSTVDSESVHGGRGIGLNLVRDRILELKGDIKLQSELDKGTEFNIFIPAGSRES